MHGRLICCASLLGQVGPILQVPTQGQVFQVRIGAHALPRRFHRDPVGPDVGVQTVSVEIQVHDDQPAHGYRQEQSKDDRPMVLPESRPLHLVGFGPGAESIEQNQPAGWRQRAASTIPLSSRFRS